MAKKKDLTKTFMYRFWFGPKQWLYKANWTLIVCIVVIGFLTCSVIYHLIVDPW